MERFKEGVDNTMPFIMLISVLLMNILLITGIMKLFFGWSPTIIAGVIAFIGAIIGGSITLIGVNNTIQEGRRKEELESSLLKLKYTNTLTNKLSELHNEILLEEPGYKSNIKIFSKLHGDVIEIATSIEALVLGVQVTDAISLLGQTVLRARLDFALKKVPEFDDVSIELFEKIADCYEVIDSIKNEVTHNYQKL